MKKSTIPIISRATSRPHRTSTGEPSGYIDCAGLKQLWIHTGTECNLRCPDCFEGAGPGNHRLERICLDDAGSYLETAAALGAGSFGFTGGEPFMNRHIMSLLNAALELAPCLVLTNATQPLRHYFARLPALAQKKHPLNFRVSVDYPQPEKHEARRGAGTFHKALESLQKLHAMGFHVAVARLLTAGENGAAIAQAYQSLFRQYGLPQDTTVVAFPDLQRESTPEISENCIATYHTPQSCANFMCAYSRMLVKQNGRTRIYACTLVDDSPDYDCGDSLPQAIGQRIYLHHRRCFACFSSGVSCGQT